LAQRKGKRIKILLKNGHQFLGGRGSIIMGKGEFLTGGIWGNQEEKMSGASRRLRGFKNKPNEERQGF